MNEKATGWKVRINEKEYPAQGPAMLRQWAKQGRVQKHHSVYRPSSAQWLPAGEMPELRDLFTLPANAVACTACGYVGPGRGYEAVQVLLLLFLAFAFLIPAIIYAAVIDNWKKRCPKCDQKALVPADSPRGRDIAAKA